MNTKGGVGKSTIVSHLAGWLKVQKKQKVMLCDCDPQQSSSRWIENAIPDLQVHHVKTNGDLTAIIMKKKDDEIIVIDGKAGDGNISRGILLDSDLVVIPSSPSLLDFEVTQKQCDLVKRIRMITQSEKPHAIVVLNKIGRDKQSQDMLENDFIDDIPVHDYYLKYRSPYSDAAGKRKLVWDLPFFTLPAQREMSAFLQAIFDTAVKVSGFKIEPKE